MTSLLAVRARHRRTTPLEALRVTTLNATTDKGADPLPATASKQRAVRKSHPYAGFFRALDPEQRQQELTRLKELRDEGQMTIRQIATLNDSSYGYMQARLADARDRDRQQQNAGGKQP